METKRDIALGKKRYGLCTTEFKTKCSLVKPGFHSAVNTVLAQNSCERIRICLCPVIGLSTSFSVNYSATVISQIPNLVFFKPTGESFPCVVDHNPSKAGCPIQNGFVVPIDIHWRRNAIFLQLVHRHYWHNHTTLRKKDLGQHPAQ